MSAIEPEILANTLTEEEIEPAGWSDSLSITTPFIHPFSKMGTTTFE
jgi:hypothetical protein